MSLLDRLRPQWRDPDPQTRRSALKKLDDAAILRQIAAGDADAAVRDAAATRLREVLVTVAIGDGDLSACLAALDEIDTEASCVEIVTRASHAEVRARALESLVSDRGLRDVVRSATDPVVRDLALDRIQDPDMLRRIAVGDVAPDVAIRAVERIADPATLAAIAEHPTAPKAVRQRARERAPDAPVAAPTGTAHVRARQHAIVVELDGFANTWDCDGIADRIRAASTEWDALAADVAPVDDIAARYERARDAALVAVATWERRREATLHVEHTHAEQIALIERVETLAPDAPGGLAEVTRAWNALDPLPDAETHELTRRFRAACTGFAARHEAWTAARTLLEDLGSLVADAERLAGEAEPPPARVWKDLTRRWQQRVPDGDERVEIVALRARFDAAADRIRAARESAGKKREQSQKQNLARLQQLMTRIDAAATAETLAMKGARRDLRTAEAAIEDLGPLPAEEDRKAWKARLEVGHDLLLRRIRQAEENEEWRRFANAGVQEQLIARVQTLLDGGDLAAASKQLGDIQKEWERAATAPRDRSEELWNSYRTVRNALRKRVTAYQADNLGKKQALCDRVALLADSTDWNETTDEIKRLQAEWKAIGPVPFKHTEALWRRFREPCDRFFAKRKEHFGRIDAAHDENAQRKLALIERAEALADSKDWEATTNAFKKLQAKWKETGPVSRRDGDVLWKRFRSACDRFFDRRSRRDDLEREEHVEAATGAIEAFAAAVGMLGSESAPAVDEVRALLDAAWTALHALDDEPGTDTRKLGERFRTVCATLGDTQPDTLQGTRIDPDATRKRRERICERIESLLDVALSQPKQLTLAEQALRLKERLAAKTIGGAADDDERQRRDAIAEISRLRAQWERLGPAIGAESVALAGRFDAACARLDAKTPHDPA